MPCYKSGGCGPYESLACNECPASRPEYAMSHKDDVVKYESGDHNEFFALLDSPILKTDNVIRFSGTYQSNQELLSTHIVDVQMISMSIARKLIRFGEHVDIGVLLEKGLLHDVDEVLVGDIPRLTKYSSVQCHDALNEVAESVVIDMSIKLDGTNYLLNIWKSAKDRTIEGYILKLADMLSVAKKTSQEVSILNNYNFLRIALEMMNYIHDLYVSVPTDILFIPSSIEYIKSLLKGVEEYLSSIISDHQDIIDKFNIENTAVKYIISNRYKG